MARISIKLRRERLAKIGLCQCCGNKPARGTKCNDCITRHSNTRNKRYQLCKRLGICIKCKKPSIGKILCIECQVQHTKYAKTARKKRIDIGICAACTKPAVLNKTLCQIHLNRAKKRPSAQNAKGLCAKCNNPKPINRPACDACYEREQHRHYKLVIKVISHYGGKCVCCGQTNLLFLTIDHINGGGNAHARKVGRGAAIYRWIKRNNFPHNFRVLCASCNYGIARNQGICPHKQIIPKIFKNKDRMWHTIGYNRLKKNTLNNYGGKCVQCGETIDLFLNLDHVNDDGAQHRKELTKQRTGRTGTGQIYRWARDNNYPSSLQILCDNCNLAKSRTGFAEYLNQINNQL